MGAVPGVGDAQRRRSRAQLRAESLGRDSEPRGLRLGRLRRREGAVGRAEAQGEGDGLRAGLEPLAAVVVDENGLLEDWDVVEAIWEHTLKKRLVVEPNEHPILMGEPAHTTREKREKMVELLFEKHNPPAIFLAKNPCLAAFATGRATALVVDCGGGGTTVSAVHDGYALTIHWFPYDRVRVVNADP